VSDQIFSTAQRSQLEDKHQSSNWLQSAMDQAKSVSVDPLIPDGAFVQSLLANPPPAEPPSIANIIKHLNVQPHNEGGYFVETDRDPRTVPNPFKDQPVLENATSKDNQPTRNASTTIYYLISPKSPVGHFHRNKGRTVHTLHKGRGRYILIHADQADAEGKAPVETFVVGHDLDKGEKLQWIVEGGKFKASFLLPDQEGNETQEGLLISETVVPGFDYADHDFMTAQSMRALVSREQAEELAWLLNESERENWKAA